MKNILITLGIVVALGLGAFGVVRDLPAPIGAQSEQVTEGGCFFLNGLHKCVVRQPLKTATTTACAIKSPAATSTLAFTRVTVDTATSTATKWVATQAATAFATTTAISSLEFQIASGAQGTALVTATTSSAVLPGTNAFVFAPNTWLVWGVQGVSNITSGNSALLAGSCHAEFNY